MKLAKKLNVNTTVVNPSIICGKFINSYRTPTMEMFLPFFKKSMYLKTYLAWVHVEDVVLGHLKCLSRP